MVTPDPIRVIVKLRSKDLLHTYREYHQLTVRGLADKANKHARRRNPDVTVKPAIVGHLLSRGEAGRDTCNLATATAIAEALGCPTALLFDAQVSTVVVDGRHPATEDAA